VRIRLADTAVATVDPWLLFVEEVSDALPQGLKLAGDSALLLKLANQPLYDPDLLIQHNVFMSVLSLTFRMIGSAAS
jgi:hypothetical protein